MIVLSAGMPKSGTGWYFNLTNDILIFAGYQDARGIRDKYHLHSILRHENCNIERLTKWKLSLITILHFLDNTFVVKTHHGPSKTARYLISGGIIRATYIYRDPRDAAVSAFEHGQMLRSEGKSHPFVDLNSMVDAIKLIEQQLVIWDQWFRLGSVLFVRYEDLVADPFGELGRLTGFLSIDVPSDVLQQIVITYDINQLNESNPKRRFLHFNKGVVGRYNTFMRPEELDLCRQHFGNYLRKMGYVSWHNKALPISIFCIHRFSLQLT